MSSFVLSMFEVANLSFSKLPASGGIILDKRATTHPPDSGKTESIVFGDLEVSTFVMSSGLPKCERDFGAVSLVNGGISLTVNDFSAIDGGAVSVFHSRRTFSV